MDAVISPDFIQHLLSFPACQMWTDYDAEADILYISFRKPQQANDSVMEDDGNIYHYHNSDLVGITVLHASKQPRSSDEA